MNLARRSILLASLVFLAAAFAGPRPAGGRTAQFKSAVNSQVAAARHVGPAMGVHILDLESGETVYSFYPRAQRIIASNTKLITTAAALDRLGPGFFFETEVLIRGEIRPGALAGDLAVVGGGDPNLSGRHYLGDSFAPFRPWAAALRELGIARIEGDLVLVDGLFDAELVHPDWPREQLTRWYEAPVAALSFNDNCVLVKVSPDGRPGAPAKVETMPPVPLFRVESTARTTSRARSQGLAIGRRDDSDVLTVSGWIYQRTESVDKWVTVADPVEYFGAALRAALAEEGIALAGAVQPSPALAGEGWRRLATHRSSLLTTLEVINKRSQNFYAESLLKLLGARLCGGGRPRPGSWPAGVRAAQEFLAEAGLEPGSYRLADGSGMSRNNLFTPEQLTLLLRHMYFHRWGTEFLKTLAYSGEHDLRWAARLAEPPYRGNVLAKTGSLSGVSALSGYAKARSGRIYAFSILMNRTGARWRAESAQDRIVRALIDHG